MSQTTVVSIYLGSGQEGIARQKAIIEHAKKSKSSVSEYIWNCLKEKMNVESQLQNKNKV